MWLGKALAFPKVALNAPENKLRPTNKKKCCVNCAYDPRKEICFIQWYEIINNHTIKVDEIDKTVSCLKLCWHPNVGSKSSLSLSKEYMLVLVENIQEVVHIVEKTLSCQSEISQVVGGMRKKGQKSTMLVGYQNRFTLIVYTITVAHLKTAKSHYHVDNLNQKKNDDIFCDSLTPTEFDSGIQCGKAE